MNCPVRKSRANVPRISELRFHVPVKDQIRDSGVILSDSEIQDKDHSTYYDQAQNDKWNIGRVGYSAKYDTYDTGPMPKM
jgi:hypothetical protein